MPLLTVTDLRVSLHTARGRADALRGVSFALERGQTLGLIGESGCGKSITALALMGLLPDGAEVGGSVVFDGTELTTLAEDHYCKLRGDRLAMVFQEPMTALNPLHTVGAQITESLRLHKGLDRSRRAPRLCACSSACNCRRRVIKYFDYNDAEKVNVTKAQIAIDGKPLTQYTFKKDYFFMMGDNRYESADSRFWGFVPEPHCREGAFYVDVD